MTEAELERLDKEEQKETEKVILAILLLFTGLGDVCATAFYEIFGKYANKGRLTLQDMKRALSARELAEFNETWGTSYKRLTRWNSLMYQVRYEVTSLEDEWIAALEDLGETIIAMEAEAFDTAIDDIADILDTRWGVDNLNFVARIRNSGDQLFGKLMLEIKQRLALGANLDDILEDIDKRLGIASRAAKNTTVTEASAISTNATHEIFKAMDVKKYTYYALVDERTCEVCGSLHDKTFLMSNFEIGVTAPPIHRSCRCRIEPVMDS